MDKINGQVTIPTEVGLVDETLKIMELWGADAIRDCDGTSLPLEILSAGYKIYSTYFVARGNNEWANEHPDEVIELYLMSERKFAVKEELEIDLLNGYFREQYKIDENHSPKEWWEVVDRTTGELVDVSQWEYNSQKKTVIISNSKKWHEYTVSFLTYQIWDSTQMYNHITNNWTRPHEIPYDVRMPKTNEYVVGAMYKWLEEHSDVDVVRFTTFFYHFTLMFNEKAKEKFVDWFGYGASVSPKAIDEFEKVKGYRLRAEDFVDNGFYNTTFRIPTKAYRDYIDFVQEFVAKQVKTLVDAVHKEGKEAMMFLGDNWIGTEPYGKHFKDLGMDSVVGSVGSGVTLRMIADIPGVKYTEGRFLPYFFPDVFCENGNPVKEANENWLCARRAIMRNPVDRIGYGGYLSLAIKFPEFVERVKGICDEFRDIYAKIKGNKPYCGLKVAVLNCWGSLRTWQTHMVAHALWYKQIYSYLGAMEALSGMAVDVTFISFDDIKNNGIANDIDVIINMGDVDTAFSGGENWLDANVVEVITQWIYNGGGFIGIGEPTAHSKNGKYLQLSHILGVEKEIGYTLSYTKYNYEEEKSHFITKDVTESYDFGEGMKNIYALDNTKILKLENKDVQLAVNTFGKGRAVYISGLPYSEQNSRILMRACYFAANKEEELYQWFSDNIYTECSFYPDAGLVAVINNSMNSVVTNLYDGQKQVKAIELNPMEIKWFEV